MIYLILKREDEERVKNYNALLGDFHNENAKLLGCSKGSNRGASRIIKIKRKKPFSVLCGNSWVYGRGIHIISE